MNLVRNLWLSIQGDPRFMRRVNGWLTLVWIAMIPVSYELGWLHSVAYVSALSLWALVAGHWSSWQAARVEVGQQDEIEKEQAHPVEQRVVETIVEETEINPEHTRVSSVSTTKQQRGQAGRGASAVSGGNTKGA